MRFASRDDGMGPSKHRLPLHADAAPPPAASCDGVAAPTDPRWPATPSGEPSRGSLAGMGRQREGLAWALLGVLLFSFSVPLTKVAVEGFDPFLTATGRAVIAGVLAGVVLLVKRVSLPERRHWSPLFFTMLGAVFGWPILLALALRHTTSA